MEEHVIFYVDLLGFKNAVRSPSSERSELLTELLRDMSSLRGDFDLQKEVMENGARFTMRAAVTTFSDHIAISCPTKDLELEGGAGLISALSLAERLISIFAVRAINLGFLIRGAATVGRLFHKEGVVWGEALVDAFELESKVANYPRIVVSRKLYSRVDAGSANLFLVKDADGITHFNYVRSMIFRSGQHGEQLAEWLATVRGIANTNIDNFELSERWNEYSKWVWFRNMLDHSRAALPDALFQ